MTNIQYVSDLHLDNMKFYNSQQLINPHADILILAGDICNITNVNKHIKFFNYISKNFQYILYIPGNHEFYNEYNLSIENMENMLEDFLKSYKNIVYLNNKSIIIEDILFTGSCLWCNPFIEPPKWFKLNLTSTSISDMFKKSVNYLDKVSKLKHNKHVIITHYPPKNYNKSEINGFDCYYQNNTINLTNMPKFWIFGHIHKNINECVDNTHFLSNQRKDKMYNNSYYFQV
jgi:predicted phosphohydrolase